MFCNAAFVSSKRFVKFDLRWKLLEIVVLGRGYLPQGTPVCVNVKSNFRAFQLHSSYHFTQFFGDIYLEIDSIDYSIRF
jgi:hypothetical protein